jgi:hypothetical protein
MSEITTYDCETLAYEVREMTTEEYKAHSQIVATMEKFADEDTK